MMCDVLAQNVPPALPALIMTRASRPTTLPRSCHKDGLKVAPTPMISGKLVAVGVGGLVAPIDRGIGTVLV